MLDPRKISVVIGASRGIGLELTKLLAKDPQNQVVATMRKPFDLKIPNVQVMELDQTKPDTIKRAATKVNEADTLIINAGIGEMELLTQIPSSRLLEYLDTNVVGPHRVINAFLQALRARATRRIIYISSSVGSMTMQVGNQIGIRGPYAVSKAAGNMLVVQTHNELFQEGFTVVAIHPGWAATDMGQLAGPGAMPTLESAQHVLKVVAGLKQSDGARFFNFDGTMLPW
ncbi:hypothetical protein H2204_013042 [Knufia peltigerae]|uniref:Uncharacterized protein n=1 Tax=Knufia peltigerae TaxID=1002370 RepID=A0AA38XR57_9EURO|nr:hypothetical protein H2204_013042 [Knufia peltigerae]